MQWKKLCGDESYRFLGDFQEVGSSVYIPSHGAQMAAPRRTAAAAVWRCAQTERAALASRLTLGFMNPFLSSGNYCRRGERELKTVWRASCLQWAFNRARSSNSTKLERDCGKELEHGA